MKLKQRSKLSFTRTTACSTTLPKFLSPLFLPCRWVEKIQRGVADTGTIDMISGLPKKIKNLNLCESFMRAEGLMWPFLDIHLCDVGLNICDSSSLCYSTNNILLQPSPLTPFPPVKGVNKHNRDGM